MQASAHILSDEEYRKIMEAKPHTLSDEECKIVMAAEQYWRAYYKIEGDSADSDQTIKSLMSQIRLASGGHPAADRFFEMLEQDSRKIDFNKVYEAGKECFAKGIPYEEGAHKLLWYLSLDPKAAAFESAFQECYNELIDLMPSEDLKSLPVCLLVEFRDIYGGVNKYRVEDFFKMGYEAENPNNDQRGGNYVPAPPRICKGDCENARKDVIAVCFV